jgi:hypothetical protein
LDTQREPDENRRYKLCTETLAERNVTRSKLARLLKKQSPADVELFTAGKKVTTAAAAVENNTYEPKHLTNARG